MIKVHLDTDLGGDMDDLCALALLLRWPGGVDLRGITVVGDTGGRRTGLVRRALQVAGRTEIPVAAGADTSGGYYPYPLGLPPDEAYWGEDVPPSPNPPEDALRLLKHNLDEGCTLITIGPLTNLRLLEEAYPGSLAQVQLYIMGGYVHPTRPGFPAWGNAMDFNLQVDTRSALAVLQQANCPTLIPLSVTVETALRRAQLPALAAAGPLGALIARQAEAFALEYQNEVNIGATCPGLPADIINFQHDPLACAVALGWRDGVVMEQVRLALEIEDGLLVECPDPHGQPFRLVTALDGPRFDRFWQDCLVGK